MISSLDRDTIHMIAENMEYIQLGVSKDAGKFAKAQWLYFLIKSYGEAVDGQHRADAIEARNRLNGYPSKAGH